MRLFKSGIKVASPCYALTVCVKANLGVGQFSDLRFPKTYS